MNEINTLFYQQLKSVELDTPDGWKGDYRPRFIMMLDPLVKGTDYYFEINNRDKQTKGIDFWDKNHEVRRALIGYMKRSRILSTTVKKDFYEKMRTKAFFPIAKEEHGQYRMYWDKIEDFWNLICAVTGKTEYRVSNNSHWIPDNSFDDDTVRPSHSDVEYAIMIEKELDQLNIKGAEREAVVKVRMNQGIFRERLLKRYSRCCLCGVSEPGLLTASHIKPWAVSNTNEKLDIDNGLLLCPNHDKLFDQGYISFTDEGTIMISSSLNGTDRIFMNIDPSMKIEPTSKQREFLAYHRENVFRH